MKEKKHRKIKRLLVFLVIIALIPVGFIIANKFSRKFDSLSDTDRNILTQADRLCKAMKSDEMWPGFDLSEKTLAAVSGRIGKVFIINPTTEISSVWATKIDLPDDFEITAYRLSPIFPQTFQFRSLGNFNSNDKTYTVFDNEVYFLRYTDDSTDWKNKPNTYFASMLAHESFHYYMQKNWIMAGRFETDGLNKKDLSLIKKEYIELDNIRNELKKENPDRKKLIEFSKNYLSIMEERLENNSVVNDELNEEVCEGTAQYIGTMYSKMIQDPPGKGSAIMDVDEEKAFEAIADKFISGDIPIEGLSTDAVYHTGSLFCELFEELKIPDWKEHINSQTKEKPVTMYAELKAFIEAQ